MVVARGTTGIDLARNRIARWAGRGRRLSAGAVLLLLVVAANSGLAASQLLIEPGLPQDGYWLLPIGVMDETGAPVSFYAGDVRLTSGDVVLSDFELMSVAPQKGGEPAALAFLLGGQGLPEVIRPILADALTAEGGALRGLYLVDGDLQRIQAVGGSATNPERLAGLTPGRQPSRLWDGVLEVIKDLAKAQGDQGEPIRRTLIVIADGNEDLPSEHPLATCVDAALRARVGVHALILEGDEGGAARLKDLARRTGGHTATFRSGADLRRFLRTVESFQVLRIPIAGSLAAVELPAGVRVEVALSGGLSGTGRIAQPEALAGPNLWVIVLLAGGALAVLAGGFLLFWAHRRTAGTLAVRYHDGTTEMHPIPRSGLKLGKKQDNDLVLKDGRVSGHHGVIRARGNEVIITDLRSTNGTKVNDQPVRTTALQDGDRILLGDAVELTYRKDAGRGTA